MSTSLLKVDNLSVNFRGKNRVTTAVRNVSFDIQKGESVALIGESGSGKSVTALSILQLLPYPTAAHPNGQITYDGTQIIGLKEPQLNQIRGRKIGMIFQEPMTALNPLHTIGKQIGETLRLHQGLSKQDALEETRKLLKLVQLDILQDRLEAYPHELSGGQRQRVMIAMALANKPDLLIADEPTTALDVTVQAEILALLKRLQKEFGMALLLISHDLNLVRHHCGRVCVMKDGEIVEHGAVKAIFDTPQHPYTQKLMAALPRGRPAPMPKGARTILKADHVSVHFPKSKSFFGKAKEVVRAVDDISLELCEGETLGIVGESGSGKSTLAFSLLRLVNPTSGQISFEGQDVHTLKAKALKALRADMQIVFQDPFGALSPRMSVGDILAEGLLVHHKSMEKAEREARVKQALEEVELSAEMADRYPHEFSGGQRQRIAIARALILEPKLIALDEPTSALDMSVQIGVLDLLRRIQKERRLSYMFISHDLRVVKAMSHNIIVMKDGKIVESGSADEVFDTPQAPYTQRLLAASFLKAEKSDQ